MKQHYCPKHPEDGPSWQPGAVVGCQYHDQRGRSQPKVKGIVSKKEKRAMDRNAGVVGKQTSGVHGDFISG